MRNPKRIGIIDIGSNSIRLVIYEITAHRGYHMIDESKASIRLSARISNEGAITNQDLDIIVQILNHFQLLCRAHRTEVIRAVATAAIRHATNSKEVMQQLISRTGLNIELISGYEEARLGFIGAMNTLSIEDGFLIDIGGGSTEVTLFIQRRMVHTVSFAFGAVNTTKQFISNRNEAVTQNHVSRIRRMVENALEQEKWIYQYPGLPVIGFGGTIRTLAKIHQKQTKYSFRSNHNYPISLQDMEQLSSTLQHASLAKRKKIEGLSSDRADIIVPGTCILLAIGEAMQANNCVISGAGLRDGLFYETWLKHKPILDNVLDHSVSNVLALHPIVSLDHVQQVKRLSVTLFHSLSTFFEPSGLSSLQGYLSVAALLHRIGVSVSYYNYVNHTYYLIMNSRINGLSHREVMICALIASFHSETRTRQLYIVHQDLLTEEDYKLVLKLGSILRLAKALDRSETQPISSVKPRLEASALVLDLQHRHDCSIEIKEMKEESREFTKQWGLALHIASISKL